MNDNKTTPPATHRKKNAASSKRHNWSKTFANRDAPASPASRLRTFSNGISPGPARWHQPDGIGTKIEVAERLGRYLG
jgi:hypothetical protein